MAGTTSAKRLNYSSVIRSLLSGYGVSEAGIGRWRSRCPLSGCSSGDPFIATQHGRYWCYSCKAEGRLSDLYARLTGASAAAVERMLSTLPEAVVALGETLLPPYEQRHGQPTETREETQLAPYLRSFSRYLLRRGFSETVLARYDVGYDSLNQRIVIPTRDVAGQLVGLTFRVDRPGSLMFKGKEVKYWHDGFDKSQHLYGLHHWANKPGHDLFLVEGQLDTCRMFQLRCRAAGVMGSAISKAQVTLLQRHARCERLVLAYDNDPAGLHSTHHSANLLIEAGFARQLHVLEYSGKDPGELQTRASFHIREYHSWLNGQLKKDRRSWR